MFPSCFRLFMALHLQLKLVFYGSGQNKCIVGQCIKFMSKATHFNVLLMCHRCLFLADENECLRDKNVCGFGAVCENVRGSYLCHCQDGYYYDGKSCQGKFISFYISVHTHTHSYVPVPLKNKIYSLLNKVAQLFSNACKYHFSSNILFRVQCKSNAQSF